MTDIQNIRNAWFQFDGQRNRAKKLLKESEARTKELIEQRDDIQEAQSIIQLVAKQTQEQIQFQISNLVSMGLSVVFEDNPYEFGIEFVERRNNIECDLFFIRDGERVSPMDAAGGGPVDVTSFLLRVALWSLKRKSRNTFILDEPFKFLSVGLQPRAAELLKIISQKLNLQIIMVTHSNDLADIADTGFLININNGVSKVV